MSKKDKKKKKGGKLGDYDDEPAPAVAFADGPPPGQGSDAEAAAAKGPLTSQKPIEKTADELADEEWALPAKKQGKKGKKGKAQSGVNSSFATIYRPDSYHGPFRYSTC